MQKSTKQINFCSVFDSVPSMCLLLQPDSNFTIAAVVDGPLQNFLKMHEVSIGQSLLDAFPEELNAEEIRNLSESLHRVLSTGAPDTMPLQKYKAPSSSFASEQFEERWRIPINSPILDSKGEIQYIMHQVKDVTEIVRLKQTLSEQNVLYKELQQSQLELRTSQTQLEKAISARDELISICSHELRTPVASMKLQTQMIKRNLAKGDPLALAPERMKKTVEQSDRQLDRLSSLIEEMLDFSKIQAGRMKLNSEPFDLAELILEVVERLEPQAQAANCTFELMLKSPTFGRWDRHRLDQVLTNTVGNAIKYAPGKPICIQLHKGETTAILSIKDEGSGIAPENCERIFEPYERVVSVKNISGLGLGLYIAKQIIEAHHGEIILQSGLGKGAAFIVTLPLDYLKTENGIENEH